MRLDIKERFLKCYISPAYFINECVLVKDSKGKYKKVHFVSDKQVEEIKKFVKKQRRFRL